MNKNNKQWEWRICLRNFYWMPERMGGKTWEADDGFKSGNGKTPEEAIINYLKAYNLNGDNNKKISQETRP